MVDRQCAIDGRIFDLIDTVEHILDLIADVRKLREDAVRLEPIVASVMNQLVECAVFVCDYFKPSFIGMLLHLINCVSRLTILISETNEAINHRQQ